MNHGMGFSGAIFGNVLKNLSVIAEEDPLTNGSSSSLSAGEASITTAVTSARPASHTTTKAEETCDEESEQQAEVSQDETTFVTALTAVVSEDAAMQLTRSPSFSSSSVSSQSTTATAAAASSLSSSSLNFTESVSVIDAAAASTSDTGFGTTSPDQERDEEDDDDDDDDDYEDKTNSDENLPETKKSCPSSSDTSSTLVEVSGVKGNVKKKALLACGAGKVLLLNAAATCQDIDEDDDCIVYI